MIERTTAASILSLAHGVAETGPDKCYYCGTACPRKTPHGELPPAMLHWSKRPAPTALCPGNSYCCSGCSIWKRARGSFPVLGGGVRDNTSAKLHSWYVTPSGAWVIGRYSTKALYERLVTPPCRFFLSLLEGPDAPDNLLQLCVANDNPVVRSDTPLHFTINNVKHSYTVYELQQAVHGEAGREPGVRALVRVLGPFPKELSGEPAKEEMESKAGKPRTNDIRAGAEKKLVRKSGG